ncbi:hypothetical protein ACHWQZ_G014356 [Mnemiopsis leidyi]
MKLTLKTLSKVTFEVEIDENLKVSDLKRKVEEVKGASYPSQNLKLIYAGKILEDEKAIKEYDISAFIVVMVSKPKPKPAAQSTEQSTSSATTTPAPATTTPAPEPAQPVAAAAPPTTTPTTAPAATQPTSVDNMLVSGQEYATAVAEMEAMGFQKAEIERAMAASFMNPHRAIDYLFNPSLMPAVPQAAPPSGDAAAPAPTPPTEATGGTQPAAESNSPAAGVGAGNLDFLRNQPQFQVLRRMIEQNPQMLQNVLQELGQANPQLLQAIQANPQQFINLLQEAPGGGDAPANPQAAPPPGTVQITPAEKEAIDRIKALGFPEHLVVQAYFACDKNENLAAEFLFSENFQDDNP